MRNKTMEINSSTKKMECCGRIVEPNDGSDGRIWTCLKCHAKSIELKASVRIENMILEKGDIITTFPPKKVEEKRPPRFPLSRTRKNVYEANQDIEIQGQKISRGGRIKIAESEQEKLNRTFRRLKFREGQN